MHKIAIGGQKIGNFGPKFEILALKTTFWASWKKSYIYRGLKLRRLAVGPMSLTHLLYTVYIVLVTKWATGAIDDLCDDIRQMVVPGKG